MRVLQLSTHTTLRPRHGGQLRSHHIGRVLEAAGFDVRRVAFGFRPQDHEDDPREPLVDVGRGPFWGSPEHAAHGESWTYVSDYVSAVAALQTPEIRDDLSARVRESEPDVILLEHPWSWPLVALLDEVASGRVPIVYSSQNVEAALKRRIFAEENLDYRPGTFEAIEALERDLVAHAAGVSTCTGADAREFAAWGAQRVVVAPNGGVRRARDHLIDLLPQPLEPSNPYLLAVGSGHPPNVSGFLDLVVPALTRLRPNQRVVLAGGVGCGVQQALHARGVGRMAEGRLVVLGQVDDFTLDCVIANAHALLLPIQYGGGSNVKTAEALLSGRPIVATETAMRGFDACRDLPGVSIAGDPEGFGRAMFAALAAPFQELPTDHPALSALLWDSTIQPLVGLLRDIAAEKSLHSSGAAFAARCASEEAGQPT